MSSTLAGLAVLLGVALRVWAYAADPAFWLDEILLARNILGLSLGALLTEPLLLDQVAPRGFLLVEKLAGLTLGPTELALRLFPFVCSIAGLLLFHRLAGRVLEGWAVPFAVTLCAIGVPFIRYGVELKQYHVDVTATVLLLLLGLSLRRHEPTARRLALAAVTGLVLPWLAQASVMVMAGIGLAFLVLWGRSRDRGAARVLVVVMPVWAVSALVAVAVGRDSMSPSTSEFMQDFWAGGFLPLPFEPARSLAWARDQLLSVFSDYTLLRYPWAWLFLTLTAIGLVGLWRTRREAALLLAGPLIVATGAAVAQQYPLRGRLMFYLLPCFLLMAAAGAEAVRRFAARRHRAVGATIMSAMLIPPVLALAESPPPYDIESTRLVLGHLQRHRRPGDLVHVFPLSRVGFLFYGPRYGLRPEDWTTGVCDRDDTRAYVRDVDRYRGVPRLWVVSSSPRPYRVARAAVAQYLSTIGVRLDSLTRPSLQFGSVALELYDLSDTARLRAATASSFPVPPMPADPRPGCRPWIRPSPLDHYP